MEAPSVARFTIRRCLGEGGMGIVYEAFDEERRVPIALKTLQGCDGLAIARFKREFRALQGLSHPNLVTLDELFFENDQWFLTMELVDGLDFVSYMRGVPFGASSRLALQSTLHGNLAGLPPADTVPPPSLHAPLPLDAARLRDGLRQLLAGLDALHAADKVHRDVKPSNVLVTHEGRVVLLDFGLVMEGAEDRSIGLGVVGTPAYMAPEQAASRELGPAADLYSVGVMLYELLTGRMPFEGMPSQVLVDKQTGEPPSPSSIDPSVPRDLEALCVSLLRFDPARRPTAAEAIRALSKSPAAEAVLPRTPSQAPAFVGRGDELRALETAFADTAKGHLSAVLVCGESGIGKSYLVRRFTAQLVGDDAEALVLQGRCYEREAVPYKALDGIIDALSHRLSRMPSPEVAALLPLRTAALAQVFPVMLRIEAIARERATTDSAFEPHELRQRAFGALRELFERLANRRPTVISIDDLQWADDDGLRAIAEILRPPDAPPLLFVGTVRVSRDSEESGKLLGRLRAAIPGDVRVVDLARLGHDDARTLAATLLRRANVSEADSDVIANEAGGHPLFVEELARHVALGGLAPDDVKLDDAIWSRVVQLDPATREMAELVAIAGKPLPQEVVAAAARFEPAEFTRRAGALRAANLVRTGGARWGDAIEPYHDRVREAVLARLHSERRRALHGALAIAFEASARPDPETLAVHWKEAGNGARAAAFAEAAGDQASRILAFDHAARLYEQAYELSPGGHAGRRELRVKLGNALAFAGRGALAAPHFEAAAVDSPPLEALELRRRAAEQLLRSGHFDPGIEATRGVLRAVGIYLPTTLFGTLVFFLFYRSVLALRGLGFREPARGRPTHERLMRIDTCFSVAVTLTFVDPFLAVVFATRALLMALSAGDIERIARSLATEVAYRGTMGGTRSWPRIEPLAETAARLADQVGTAHARSFVTGTTGGGLFASGQFRAGAEHLHRFFEMLEEGATGLVFERVSARAYLIMALSYLGRLKELSRLQREGLRDALARGDVYAAVSLRIGVANWAWLVEDQPELAESHARAAMEEWSTRGFHLEHFHGWSARVNVALYTGEREKAHELATSLFGKARRSLLWGIPMVRVHARFMRAACAIGVARHLREATRDARAIEREGLAWSQPFAALLRAGIALRAGERDAALAALDVAAARFDAGDMAAYAAATRDRAARLRGGPTLEPELARAEAFFRGEGVVAPERMIGVLTPGLVE